MSHRHPDQQFDSLYQQHQTLVRTIIYRTLAARGIPIEGVIADVAQIVWLACWQHLQAGRPVTKAWLTLRAQSRAFDYLASPSTRVLPLDLVTDAETDADDGCPASDAVIQQPIIRSHPQREAVAALVDTLPPGPRRAVELVHYGGLSTTEAAREMGISTAAVRQHLSRGVAALRDRLLGIQAAA